jgi:hypothetical protein
MKEKDRKKKDQPSVTRRDFIKRSATAGTMTVAGLATRTSAEGKTESAPARSDSASAKRAENDAASTVDRHAVLLAMGDTLIPSAPGDPGYKDLEWYGITSEVNRRLAELPDADLELFSQSSREPLGKEFAQLSAKQRADYFNLILQADGIKDQSLRDKLRAVYDLVREVVLTVYYQNFPQNHWPVDEHRVPMLRSGDRHQITNPNTPEIPTGWDLAGYAGPLTWEEEERRRNYFKKIRWQE